MSQPIDLHKKLSLFSDHWSPRTVAQMNDLAVMVVKLEGEFKWHHHDDTDDFFMVLDGELEIGLREPDPSNVGQLKERTVTLGQNEIFVVPRGIEHRPAARKGEVKVMVMEPKGTPNTGDAATAAPYIEV